MVVAVTQVHVQSLLVAEVVGGAKTTAQKSSLKNLTHLCEGVSIRLVDKSQTSSIPLTCTHWVPQRSDILASFPESGFG